MTVGRPQRPKPDDFEEVFERVGWEAADHFGTNPARVKRWLGEQAEDVKRRRRTYILGRRLSSLKTGAA